MQSFQKQMFNAFFETLLEQLCRRRERKLAGCRFAFGTDVGETERCNGDVVSLLLRAWNVIPLSSRSHQRAGPSVM